MLHIISHLENVNQDHNETPLSNPRDGYNQKDNIKCWQGCSEIRNLIHCWGECKNNTDAVMTIQLC